MSDTCVPVDGGRLTNRRAMSLQQRCLHYGSRLIMRIA